MKKKKDSIFTQWVLDNRFSVGLINIFLCLVIVLIFNKVSFVLNPVKTFMWAILPPVILALLQYYLMNPVVDWLEKKFKVPRTVTILLIFALVICFLVWMINTLIPLLQHQIQSLIDNWPSIWKNASETVQGVLKDPRMGTVRASIDKQLASLQKNMSQIGDKAIGNALSSLTSAVNVAATVFMTLFTAPFILFFMLKDGHELRPYLVKFAPERWEKATSELLHEVNAALSSYVRGQMSVAFCVGIMFFIGYSIIGQSYGAALAIFAGCMNLIPYFGTTIGLIPSLIVAAVTSWSMVLKVLLVFAIEQVIETRVISPMIVGNRMKMHPVTTIIVMLGAGSVWGLWGVVAGIPLYAVLKIFVSRFYNYYRKVSHLYNDDGEAEAKADLGEEQKGK
ncbi:AI-2E family transporter [Lactobacillus sp. 23-2]|uniref:AI-2E family transporter n=1 Tax=Lactobacillus sp. 23-2 TaxID=2981842 RepID=UPI0038382AB4